MRPVGPGKEWSFARQHGSLVRHIFSRNFGAHSSRNVRGNIQKEERKKRREIKAKNGRDNAAEEVQVWVCNGEYRLQNGNALSLREPREQDASRDDEIIKREEVGKAALYRENDTNISETSRT